MFFHGLLSITDQIPSILVNSNLSNWFKRITVHCITVGAHSISYNKTKPISTMRSLLLRWTTSTISCLVTMMAVMPASFTTTVSAAATTTTMAASSSSLRGARLLQEPQRPSALTTTACNIIRQEDYEAELQLVYEYLVEFEHGGSRSLTGIETAIAREVAQGLSRCDALDRPLYKVKANTVHTFSKTEFCAPQVDGNTCSVVVGATAILLDTNPAHVQDDAYTLIEEVLNNTELLASFAPSVARAEYIKPIDNTLVFSPENYDSGQTTPGSVTATIAVAAASVSFLVASIFCYGLLRRDMRNHPEPSIRHKNRLVRKGGRQIVGNPMGIRHRQHSFVRLEDFAVSPAGHTSMVTTSFASSSPGVGGQQDYTPSITWSISDITSDSASLRSNLSRRTSNLERIEEEEEESDNEYEDSAEESDDDDDQSSDFYHRHRNGSFAQVYGLSPIKYTAENFFQEPRHGFAELQGCRFVEEFDRNNAAPPVASMPDVDDDLQISLDDDEDGELEEPLPSLLDGVPTWNPRSPKIGTDEDSLHLKSLKARESLAGSVSSALVHNEESGRPPSNSERESEQATILLDTDVSPVDSWSELHQENHVEDRGRDDHVIPNNLAEILEANVDPSLVPKGVLNDESVEGHDPSSNLAEVVDANVGDYVPASRDSSLAPEGVLNDESVTEQEVASESVEERVAPVAEPNHQPAALADIRTPCFTQVDYDSDEDEQPWIGIANGTAIVVIDDDDYTCHSECPATPRSDVGYETDCFETPRQYEDATDRSYCDEI